MKKITLNVEGATSKQWSNFVLELNIMKKAWRSYGVDINMKASGLKNVLNYGTKVNDGSDNTKRRSVSTNSSIKTNDGWNSVDKRR